MFKAWGLVGLLIGTVVPTLPASADSMAGARPPSISTRIVPGVDAVQSAVRDAVDFASTKSKVRQVNPLYGGATTDAGRAFYLIKTTNPPSGGWDNTGGSMYAPGSWPDQQRDQNPEYARQVQAMEYKDAAGRGGGTGRRR
jgi:hypothetical protein